MVDTSLFNTGEEKRRGIMMLNWLTDELDEYMARRFLCRLDCSEEENKPIQKNFITPERIARLNTYLREYYGNKFKDVRPNDIGVGYRP